jgi:hypothetical protein
VWRYDLTPEHDGTAVTQSYQVMRPVPIALHLILRGVLGVRDLRADLHANMETSLARVAAIAERETPDRPAEAGHDQGGRVVAD